MVEVHFATNRNRTTKARGYFGERFNADGPQFYRVGSAELEKVSDDMDEGYQLRDVAIADERKPRDASGHGQRLGSAGLFAGLREVMRADNRDVVVLVHGFGNTFVNSLQRAAQIKQAYLIDPGGAPPYEPHVVVFSWPSNGRVFPPWEYHDDRDDAAASGTAMARFLMRFLDFLGARDERCAQRIHVVAHSMGNWALRHAVLGIRSLLGEQRLPKVFANVLLMAADEDEDALERHHKLGLLPELARAIHVYHSRGDEALMISDKTKFNPDRLGSGGPRTFSDLSARAVAIDCVKVDHTMPLHANHQYYRIRKEVIADARAVLSGRVGPDEIPGRVPVEPGRRYRIEG